MTDFWKRCLVQSPVWQRIIGRRTWAYNRARDWKQTVNTPPKKNKTPRVASKPVGIPGWARGSRGGETWWAEEMCQHGESGTSSGTFLAGLYEGGRGGSFVRCGRIKLLGSSKESSRESNSDSNSNGKNNKPKHIQSFSVSGRFLLFLRHFPCWCVTAFASSCLVAALPCVPVCFPHCFCLPPSRSWSLLSLMVCRGFSRLLCCPWCVDYVQSGRPYAVLLRVLYTVAMASRWCWLIPLSFQV